MQKIISTAICLILLLACGCSRNQTDQSQETSISQKTDKPLPSIGDASAASTRTQMPKLPPAPNYPPAPDLPPAPDTIRIAVISDINGSYGSIGYNQNVKNAVQDIIRRKAHFVVSPGDLIAGQKPGLNYAAMWKAFHYEVGDVFFDNDIQFLFAPGNHDASAYPQHANERIAYANAFQNRRPVPPLLPDSKFPFYYAVNIRDILVIALDITRPIDDADPQLDWLDSILHTYASNRLNIILGHLPISPINMMQFWEVAGSPRLLKILQQTPHTVYISGHHHIFYPGHIGELRTIAAPALGSGPNSLKGEPPVSGYVMIEIPPDSPARVTALVAPNFNRMIALEDLPEHIIKTDREDIGMAEYIMEMLDHTVQRTHQ